ncbi:MAG: hypothetical protein NXY57DRAFT_326017 [Lentinula lateritia]|uniref:Uncharacterized protein n=1 Tax=Lentinula lateritia TaxID=40482 RepID=A0ABQ8VNT0_9AGAR|nr:MAG: hypothetical protein NXY57DRAFT_326017 [Lentinula lateritia]KAJ4495487.1 hypothetical protein C8R41DRAFT_296330 [Lentinula lateritia]
MASISLSYADRAKNAQNIRSPIENTVHAISVSIPESTSTSSPFSSNASSRSSTSSNTGSSTVISSSSTDVDADITAPTTSNSSVIVESDGECNGGQQEQKKQREREREEEVSRITTRKPSVNVWEQRMNRGSASSSFPLISSSSKSSTTNSAFIKKDNDLSVVKVRPTSNNWSARPTPASPSRLVSLDLRNSNAWPEVGVGLSSPSKDKGKGKLSNEEVSVVQAKPPYTRMNLLFVSNTNYSVHAFQKTKIRKMRV